jgi:hypothetical protein
MTTRNNSMCQRFNFNLMTLIPPLQCVCFSADEKNWTEKAIWAMKRQFILTHTIRQTEFAALLDRLVTNTSSVKMLCPQKNWSSSYFRKTLECLVLIYCGSVVFLVSFQIVCWWFTKSCCFINYILNALLFTIWIF